MGFTACFHAAGGFPLWLSLFQRLPTAAEAGPSAESFGIDTGAAGQAASGLAALLRLLVRLLEEDSKPCAGSPTVAPTSTPTPARALAEALGDGGWDMLGHLLASLPAVVLTEEVVAALVGAETALVSEPCLRGLYTHVLLRYPPPPYSLLTRVPCSSLLLRTRPYTSAGSSLTPVHLIPQSIHV